MTIRVIIADDHPVTLMGMANALDRFGSPQIQCVAQAGEPSSLLELLVQQNCDVVVVDLNMPNTERADGLQLITYIRRHYVQMGIIVITTLYNANLCQAIFKAGANGVFDKRESLEMLVEAIRAVHAKRLYISHSMRKQLDQAHEIEKDETALLSQREIEVLRLYILGFSGRDIAQRLQRSEKTVSHHKRSAMIKLGVHHDSQLSDAAHRFGLRL